MKSKRFVVRKSLIGKNQIIEVTFKNGNVAKYNHDEVFEVMKSKLEKHIPMIRRTMWSICWSIKYTQPEKHKNLLKDLMELEDDNTSKTDTIKVKKV